MGQSGTVLKVGLGVLILVSIILIITCLCISPAFSERISRVDFGGGTGSISYTFKASSGGRLYISYGADEPFYWDYGPYDDDDYNDHVSYTVSCEVCDANGRQAKQIEKSLLLYEHCYKIDRRGSYNITISSNDCPYRLWGRAIFMSDISYRSCFFSCCIGPFVLVISICFLIIVQISSSRERKESQKEEQDRQRRIGEDLEPPPEALPNWKEDLDPSENVQPVDDYYYRKWGTSYKYDND